MQSDNYKTNSDQTKIHDIEDFATELGNEFSHNGKTEVSNGSKKDKIVNLADRLKTKQPYFKVELSKLLVALKVSSLIKTGVKGDLASNTIGFKANTNAHTLKIYSSDFKIYFSYEISLFRMGSEDKVCEEFFAIHYEVLKKLINVCEGVLFVYEENKKFFLKLEEGDIEIETTAIPEKAFECKDQATKVYDSVNIEFLKSVLQTFYPYSCLTVKTNYKHLYVVDNTFYAQYMFSCARLKSPYEIPNMDLTAKEIKMLYTILDAANDKQLVIKINDKRIYFVGENFVFSKIVTGGNIAQDFIDSIDSLIFISNFNPTIVSTASISKIADLSAFLTDSNKPLQFNYSDKNTLTATMITKNSNSIFCIGTVGDGCSEKPFEMPIAVQSKLLFGMLKLFKDCEYVDFYMTPHGIGMRHSIAGSNTINIESILFIETENTVKNGKEIV